MELECEKYREKINYEMPACKHPDDYCQFRTACIIYFMEMENRRAKDRDQLTSIVYEQIDQPL